MKKIIKLQCFVLILLTVVSCSDQNLGHHSNPSRLKFYNKNINYAINGKKETLDIMLQGVKDTAKTKFGRKKIAKLAELKRQVIFTLIELESIISKIKKNRGKENVQNLMLNQNGADYSKKISRKFDQYNHEYQKENAKYLSDTSSWAKRYIQLLPEEQRESPPSFGEFYFKDTNKDEVLVTLNIFRLAILQEALEIQKKIINEK